MLKLLEIPFPKEIRLENTNACNARCVICPREKQTRKIGAIAPRLVDRIVQEAKGKGVRKFTVQGFGEPLLDKGFCRHVQQVKQELNCRTFSVSNGSLITPELARDMVTCGLDKIKISFYGINRQEYESVHHRLSFEQTVQAVKWLIEAKRAARSKLKIRLQYIGRLWRFVPFALQWAAHASVGYSTLHNYGGGRGYQKVRRSSGKCPILAQPILQVLWDGRVTPCCYDFNGTMILGDLRRQSIEDVWNGEPYRRLREAQETEDFSEWTLCRSCDRRLRPWLKLSPPIKSQPVAPAEALPILPLEPSQGDESRKEAPKRRAA